MTRGLRNNNPLNIRHSADRWSGWRWTEKEEEEEDPSIWDEYWKWSPEG